ncbi:MAG: hypothetical protein PHN80_13780 [Hespellia sp.]|nr:hypothetical protein [Hespellia sp.]
MNESHATNQICVLKTNRKLVAFYDKLRVAATTNYAQLHADGEYTENGRKIRSLIGLTLLDYSNGKGNQTISVRVNLSPDEVEYIFSRLHAGFPVFEYRQDKIFGTKDEQGYSQVTKLSITRNTHDYQGNPLRIPWRIEAENGKGIAFQNQTGGTYMQKNSFQPISKAFLNVTDADMYCLLNRVVRYTHMWESAIATGLISNGKQAYQALLAENAAKQTQAAPPNNYYAA